MIQELEDGMIWDLLHSLVRLHNDLQTKTAEGLVFLTACHLGVGRLLTWWLRAPRASVPDAMVEVAPSFMTKLHEPYGSIAFG